MTSDRKPPPAPPASRSSGRRTEDPIVMGLRRLWSEVESEGVPDDFLDLLDQIDSRRAEAEPEDAGPEDPAAAPETDGRSRKPGE